jgi:[ribosomal protein S18]-alanine N-acetyltransferase
MVSPHIRRAILSDLDGLLSLEAGFSGDRLNRRNFRHLIQRGHADIWVYDDVARVVGDAVVFFRRGSTRARLYSLATAPDLRNRGIGTALLQAAEQGARDHGCLSLTLEVHPDNAAALRLYHRFGYCTQERKEDFYENGDPALSLMKPFLVRVEPDTHLNPNQDRPGLSGDYPAGAASRVLRRYTQTRNPSNKDRMTA